MFSGCGSLNDVDGELHYYNNVSTGKQLIDLKEALDKKIINQNEFDTLKTSILNSSLDLSRAFEQIKDK